MNAMLVVVPALFLAAGGPESVIQREVPDDPYLPRPAEVAEPTPSLPVPAGANFGVQVNVSGLGNNIPGDAANEPSIAVDPTAPNRMVIGWRQFDTINSNFRQAGWGWSHDGGRTWTFPGVIEPGNFRSDPVLGADAEGAIYYCSLSGNFTVQFFKSFDGGLTWGPPVPAFGGDKQWFSIDRTGGPGHGNVYMAWSVNAGCCGPDVFTRSFDGANSFLAPSPVFGTPFFGTTAVAPDGAIYVSGVVGDFGVFLVVGSPNAGNPQQIPAFNMGNIVDLGGEMVLFAGGSPNPAGLLGQVDIAIDSSGGPSHGNIYALCSVDPPGADPLDVMFSRSVDGGTSWSSPVRINDDLGNNWQWFGTISVAPNGRLDVVWNDTRNSGQVNISQLFYSSSIDAGETWSTNEALSPVFDSHIGWPNQNKLGDYYDMKSDLLGANLAWAATFNGEQDVYFLRIGEYDCNGNGVGDPDDIAAETSADCNANSIPDECEITAGTAIDSNDNGMIDACECAAADLDDSGDVGITDFLALLGAWGTDPGGPPDLNGDGDVGIEDFLALLALWGRCR